jgi:hypothetical protein
MPTLALTNFNIVCATLGGFITVFGLVSYLFKEKFYLSEACKNLGFKTLLSSDINMRVSNLSPCRSDLLTSRDKLDPTTGVRASR